MDFQQPASFKLGRTSENGEEKDSRPLESTVKIYVRIKDSICIKDKGSKNGIKIKIP